MRKAQGGSDSSAEQRTRGEEDRKRNSNKLSSVGDLENTGRHGVD